MASKSMDQEQMLLIVVLVGALLYMFMKNHKGGICSLFGGNKETYIIGGQAGEPVIGHATRDYVARARNLKSYVDSEDDASAGGDDRVHLITDAAARGPEEQRLENVAAIEGILQKNLGR